MNVRKQEIREIVLAILFGREKVKYQPDQFSHLILGVGEVMARRDSNSPGRLPMSVYPELSESGSSRTRVGEFSM
jgi:hypothetical protein